MKIIFNVSLKIPDFEQFIKNLPFFFCFFFFFKSGIKLDFIIIFILKSIDNVVSTK